MDSCRSLNCGTKMLPLCRWLWQTLRSIIWALDFKLLHYHTNWNLCSMSRKLGRPWKKWQDIIQNDLKDIGLTWDVERELAHSWSSWFSVATVCLSHGMNRSRFSSVTLAVDMWLVGPNALPGPLVVSKHNRSCMLINTTLFMGTELSSSSNQTPKWIEVMVYLYSFRKDEHGSTCILFSKVHTHIDCCNY